MLKYSFVVLAALIFFQSSGQITLPYSEDFEGVTDQTYQDNTTSITGLSDWELIMLNASDYTLTLGDIGINDSKGMSLRNVAVGGDSDQEGIILTLDFSGYTTTNDLFFNFRMKPNALLSLGGGPFMGSGDELVFIRGSNTESWIKFFDPQSEIEDNAWIQFLDIPISDSLSNNGQDFSSTFQIRFYTSQTTFQIDDLEIKERPTNDIRLLSTNLDPAGVYTSAETISVEFENFGSTDVSDLPVTVQLTGPTETVNQQFDLSTTLNTKSTNTIDLEGTFDLSEVGTYMLEVYHSLESDDDMINDTLRFTFNHVDVTTPTLPFLEDFTDVNVNQDRSQFMASVEGVDGLSYYSNNEAELLSFPSAFVSDGVGNTYLNLGSTSAEDGTVRGHAIFTLNLSDYQVANNDLLLDFDFNYSSLPSRQVKVRVRGNTTDDWLDLYTFVDTDGWITIYHLSISDLLQENGQEFSASTQISFSDQHRTTLGDMGVDNIRIHERPETDLSLVGNTHPDNGPILSATEQVTLEIYNFGENAVTAFDLQVEVNGPNSQTTFTENVSTSIASGDTLDYTMTNKFDFSAVGDYEVSIVTDLDGDTNEENDTTNFRVSTFSTYISSLPFSTTFDGLANDYQAFKSVAEIEGITGVAFQSDTENGFVAAETSVEVGEQGLQISSSDDQPVNDLILTLDLSGQDANTDDLLFNFKYFYQRLNSNQTDENGIFLRGALDDDWIDMGTWFQGLDMNDKVLRRNHLALSDSLLTYSQNFSDQTQIRISEQKSSSSSSTSSLTILRLAVFERPDVDMVVENLVIPSSSAGLSANEAITVTLINQGALAASNIPITVSVEESGIETTQSEIVAGPINSEDELEFTLTNTVDLSNPGTYNITVYTELVADADNDTDTLTESTVRIARFEETLPLFEDFEDLPESLDTVGFQPVIENATGFSFDPSSLSFGRILSSTLDENTYLTVSSSSIRSLVLGQTILSADLSGLTTASDQVYLDFSYLFSLSFTRLDRVDNRIFIRGSEDDSWLLLFDWSIEGQGDERQDAFYLNVTDTLAAYNHEFSETFQVDFRAGAFSSTSSLNIDDVHLYEQVATDVQLSAVTPPTAAAGLGDSEEISVEIINRGTAAQTNIPVYVEFTSPLSTSTYDETVAVNLAAGDTTSVELSQTFDFSAVGPYTLKVALGLDGDPYNKFDTLIATTSKLDVYTGELPYSEDFEGIESYFSRTAESSIPNVSGFSYHKDNNITSTFIQANTIDGSQVLEMNSSSGVTHDLVLTMDLSAYTTEAEILLSFDYAQLNQSDNSNDRVFLRGTEGDAWIELFDWYDTNASSNVITFQDADSLDLSTVLSNNNQTYSATTQIRFGEEGGREFLLDNVEVFKIPDSDLSLIAVDTPDWGPDLGSDGQLTFTLNNLGKNSESNVPLTIMIEGPNGSQDATETISSVALTDESISYTTSTAFDFSAFGSYDITAYLELSTDENLSNDTLIVNSVHVIKATSGIPYLENFDGLSTENAYINDTTVVSDINGFSYRSSLNLGNLSTDDSFSISGNAILISNNQNLEDADHELILSIDLSDHSLEDSVLLDLSIAGHRNISVSENTFNKISVRGSQFDEWVELYDWYENATNNDLQFTSVNGLNISRVLGTAGDTFSSTFQLRIAKRDIAGIEEDLWVDNLKIYRSFNGLSDGIGFAVAKTGYVGLGRDEKGSRREIWKLDDQFNMEFYSLFPGESRSGAIAFSINDVVYVGTGVNDNSDRLSDLWEFDAGNNQWNQLTDFVGGGVSNATVFVIDGFAYLGTGLSTTDELSAFWKYNPSGDTWTSLESLPSGKRQGAFSFVLNGKGYVGGGFSIDDNSTFQYSDLQEFDPETNTWTEKIFADGTNLAVNEGAAFSLYGFGYVAYGNQDQIVRYDPTTNEVTNLGDEFSLGDSRSGPSSFILGDSAVVAFGNFDFFPTQYSSEINVFYEENTAPTDLGIDNNALNENNEVGQLVGTLSAQDDETLTYELATGDGSNDEDNDSFTISGNQLLAQVIFDFETQKFYHIFIKASDTRGEFTTLEVIVSINDINESPTDITLSNTSVPESTNGGDVFIGTLSTIDQDMEDTFTYSIVSGDGTNDMDNDQFYIQNENQLSVVTPSFEIQSSYVVRISTQDQSGASFTRSFSIEVTDQNDTPTDIQLDNLTVDEGSVAGTVIGVFTTTDEDDLDPSTFTYELATGSQQLFSIEGDQLVASLELETFDISEDTEFVIDVTASDDESASFTKSFTVTIVNQPDPLAVRENQNIRIFPNPFGDELQLDLHAFEGQSMILEITNTSGQIIYADQLKISNQPVYLDMTGFARGSYWISLRTGKQVVTRQILKD